VKIKSIEIHKYCRAFEKPMVTSRCVITERIGYVVRIVSDSGLRGFGEAAPLDGFSRESFEETGNCLASLVKELNDLSIPASLEGVSQLVNSIVHHNSPGVRFAIETALCDLAAKDAGKPLCEWLSDSPKTEVPVNLLLSRPVDDWSKTKKHVTYSGYPAVKIKVADEAVEDDIEFVKQLRKELGGDIKLRLDANRKWSFEQAKTALIGMKDLNIEYIEEPLYDFNPVKLARLKRETGIAVALDETLAERGKVEPLIEGGACDVIILKPTLLGGIAKTFQVIRLAGQYSRKAVITSTLETEIGIAALLHLAASVEAELLPCGLDTLHLFYDAEASLYRVVDGKIKVPRDTPGIGIEPPFINLKKL
jgi:O-succinylbenzoate synthase